jgi:hypothetical protein
MLLRLNLFYHLNLVVAQHPDVSRQGDDVLQIFFIGCVRRDGPEEESLDPFGDFRIACLVETIA